MDKIESFWTSGEITPKKFLLLHQRNPSVMRLSIHSKSAEWVKKSRFIALLRAQQALTVQAHQAIRFSFDPSN
jgi:hypothetical protein